jgi:uncharacterized protein YndB with AHSA1/START domain
MRAYTFTEIIDRPPQRVWDCMSDPALAPRWRALIKSMKTEDGQPVRAGSRLVITVEAYGRRASRVSEMVVFDPPHRQVIRSVDQPTLGGAFEFLLEPHPRGTKVTVTCDLIAKGILPWIFLPLIARSERRIRTEMLGNLKRLVEDEPGAVIGDR